VIEVLTSVLVQESLLVEQTYNKYFVHRDEASTRRKRIKAPSGFKHAHHQDVARQAAYRALQHVCLFVASTLQLEA